MEGVVRVGIYVIKWVIPHGVVVRVGFHVMTWMILYGAIARIGISTCCQSCSCNKIISIFSKKGSRILSEEPSILRFVMILLANLTIVSNIILITCLSPLRLTWPSNPSWCLMVWWMFVSLLLVHQFWWRFGFSFLWRGSSSKSLSPYVSYIVHCALSIKSCTLELTSENSHGSLHRNTTFVLHTHLHWGWWRWDLGSSLAKIVEQRAIKI